ncbi:hypothetical protein [Nocardia sp. NPDC058705]|uniref:hypothetical protein n=1 Tax=Nocardia sp. NPDC058705 TaxID=3346609 RepID=UPI0036C95981
MITIETYIRNAEGEFLPLGETISISFQANRRICGAIDMQVGYRPILRLDTWDDIDELWAYIVSMTVKFKKTGRACTLYPSQSTSLIFERIENGLVKVSSGGSTRRAAALPESELLTAVKTAGYSYFDTVESYSNQGYARQFSQLSQLP